MHYETNGNSKSKILGYLCNQPSASNKAAIAKALGLSETTVDIRLTALRKEELVDSLGNGYWNATQKGREQHELDPNLPAERKARTSSRVFSLGKVWDYIENDFFCRTIINYGPSNTDPDLLLPLVCWWLVETEQINSSQFHPFKGENPSDEFMEFLIKTMNDIGKIKKY